MKIDMHNHTKYSIDATSDPTKMIKTAIKKGLGGIAITDHDTMAGYNSMKKDIKKQDGFIAIPAMEIRVFSNRIKAGELIAYFITDKIKSREGFEVIDEIKSQDGIVSISHPFRTNGGFDFNALQNKLNRIDAVEVFNARTLVKKSNETALNYAKMKKKGFTAGSDSHCLWEIGNAGIIFDGDTVEELRKKIKKADVKIFGRQSPYWVHAVSLIVKTKRRYFNI